MGKKEKEKLIIIDKNNELYLHRKISFQLNSGFSFQICGSSPTIAIFIQQT